MPTLVNYSGEDEHYMGGSLCSMDSNRLFSVLDVYNRPSKRPRTTDSYSFFSDDQETKPSIEILPDECLYEIFRRLSSGQSRSAAACVSNRWLTISSTIRNSEIISEKVEIKNDEPSNADEQENDGYLSRSLEGKKATDTRLAAIAVGTSARGGLGKLSVRGSDKVTNTGFSAIARGCPNLLVLSLWNVPLIEDEALIAISKECCSLESLDLCHCSSISDTGLASIAENCPNLCSLTIESCKKIGNESLRAVARCCPSLQSITIKDCPLIGDQGVSTLFSSGSSVLSKVKLQSLHITDLSLAVIGRYGMSISNLALTGLRNVSLKGFWAMGNANGLQSLIYLTITACYGITDSSLEAIGNGCGSLKHMALKKCCFVSDNGLVSFAKSARFLEILHLEECNRISQRGILGTLSNRNSKLKSFSIVKCMGIKDQEPEAVDFCKSQSLRSLTIKNCIGFGNANLAMVGKLCPHLHNLDLSGLCGLTDTGLFELLTARTPGLVKVNLSDCVKLTDKIVVDLAKIHGGSLEVLNLEGCRKIGDESLSAIAENCFLLKDLDVSKCEITDLGVSFLSSGRQTDLRVLSLSGCSKVSNASLSSLEKLGTTLLGLNLQGCNLISSSVIESLVVNLWRCDILS